MGLLIPRSLLKRSGNPATRDRGEFHSKALQTVLNRVCPLSQGTDRISPEGGRQLKTSFPEKASGNPEKSLQYWIPAIG